MLNSSIGFGLNQIVTKYSILSEISNIRTPLQCESKKSPCSFLTFSQTFGNLLINFLHIYYAIISTLEYKFLFNYLQL